MHITERVYMCACMHKCTHIQHLDPLICCWGFVLYQDLGNYKQCCNEHGSACNFALMVLKNSCGKRQGVELVGNMLILFLSF